MKKIFIWLSGLIILAGLFCAAMFFFSDYQSMQAEIPERRPDIRGVLRETQNDRIIITPFDRAASPFENLSREEMRAKMASFSQEERRLFREKMQQSLLQEIKVELPKDISIYKKTKRLSRDAKRLSISNLEASNIVSVWVQPLQEGENLTAEFITVFSPEFYNE